MQRELEFKIENSKGRERGIKGFDPAVLWFLEYCLGSLESRMF